MPALHPATISAGTDDKQKEQPEPHRKIGAHCASRSRNPSEAASEATNPRNGRRTPSALHVKNTDGQRESCPEQLRSNSSPHNVDRENAALMTREQVIDEIANDRMRFVPQLRHNTASENSGSSVPFEINRAMCSSAVDFRPTMWATRTLVFGGNQIKLP